VKIAITSAGTTLDAAIDPRFGRCLTFIVVETDGVRFEVIRNESASRGGGAGIHAAEQMAAMGVRVVLTGSSGPNAQRTLAAAGIEIIEGCEGSVAETIARFKAGQLRPAPRRRPQDPIEKGQGDDREAW
jgi:predicted Fe-Mo cluster-binding NifX family protein